MIVPFKSPEDITSTKAIKKRTEYQRQWRKDNREHVNAHRNQWNADNPDKVELYSFKDRYKFATLEEAAAVLASRPEVCDVCRRDNPDGTPIAYDHCHSSQIHRGWLCKKCNTTLGFCNDDPELLETLANYLRT